jgi:hypothetical protein
MRKVTPLSVASLNTNTKNINTVNSHSFPMGDETINPSENSAVSLATTLTEFEEWRRKKINPAEAIPDVLWDKLFALADIYSPVKVRSLFNISNKQFQKKWEEKFSTNNIPINNANPGPTFNHTNFPAELCEVKIKPSTYQSQPLPNAKTMVVEFHREDGRRMILHITQDAIPLLLQDFFKG